MNKRQSSRLPRPAFPCVSLPLAVFGLVTALALGFLFGRLGSAASTRGAAAGLPASGLGLDPASQPASTPGQRAMPAAPGSETASGGDASLPALLSGVPDVRQSTGYSCGAAALQAVLAYWGTSEREDRLIARLRTTPDQGTHPDDIVRVARELGLEAELRENLALSDLETALARGATVIVDLQAWRESPEPPWAERWDDGHYMVLLGIDRENLYFEDPSLLGSRGFIPVPEFLDRWHDYEGEAPRDASDRTYVRMAIFVHGAAPAPPPVLEKVE
jgi:predicted double-glycine peptidase